MKQLPAPHDILTSLQESQLYKDWHAHHSESFLSHFFCSVTADYKAKTNWEIGFYDHEKMTVFTVLNDGFEIKPEDDIFKKPDSNVERLNMNSASVKLDAAVDTFQEKLPELFPQEMLGDGFIILQTIEGKTVWNFSFITKSVKFINMKIDVSTGDVSSHDTVELVQKN